MEIEKWRREVRSRLDALADKAKQYRQHPEAHDLRLLEDNTDFLAAWGQVQDLFPSGFTPSRARDLSRHARFAMPHDFHDIELHHIPAIRASVERYGRRRATAIDDQIEGVTLDSNVSDAIHPLIKDACVGHVRERRYGVAAETAVGIVMQELRRLSGAQADGDRLIRQVVGVLPRKVAFSDCSTHREKSVTEG